MTTPASDPMPDGATLDLYKLHAELADRVSARRTTANSFFLTVQTGLIAVAGLISPDLDSGSDWVRGVVSAAGVLLAVCWWLSLRSYRHLNKAKFEVLHKIETRLPVRMFTDEWAVLEQTRYSELGKVERFVPWIFTALWVVLFFARN